jgi:4,5-dihydroxyphthalate decarboxylase
MPVIKYVAAWEQGFDAIAIPVFPARRFAQWMVEIAENSDIRDASDLEGKRIGIRYNGNTDAILGKGVLEESYGIDLSSVSWFTVHGELVPGTKAPDGVVLLDGADLHDLLRSGDVDAVLVNGYGHEPAPGIRRLWDDPEKEAARWYESARFFPILHLVVVSTSALAEHEALAPILFQAFEQAKTDALVKWNYGAALPDGKRAAALRSGFPGSGWRGSDRSFLGRDPIPYGLEANRDGLERLIAYAVRQEALQESHSVEELFANIDA